jgi:N-acetylmuramoyl-L-alanine amidase
MSGLPSALRLERFRIVPDPGHPFEVVDRVDEVRARRTAERKARGLGPPPFIKPELLLVHYAVTHNIDMTYAAQVARGYYATLSIDGYSDGLRSRMKVIQQTQFNEYASHAGESKWNGRSSVSMWSVGIEIANPGPLVRGTDGQLRTVYGKVWPEDDAEEHPIAPGYPPQWTHWAKYSPEEIAIVVTVGLLLKEHGLIRDVVGHSDVAPKRKYDPGPAFPMQYVRQSIFREAA